MERSRAQVRRRTIWRIGAGLIGPGALCAGALVIGGVHPGSTSVTLLSQRVPDPTTTLAAGPAPGATSASATAAAVIPAVAPCPPGRQPSKPTNTPSALRVRRELRAQQRRAVWGVKAAPRRACVPTPPLGAQAGGAATSTRLRARKATTTPKAAKSPLTHAQRQAQAKAIRQAANRAARKLAHAAIAHPAPSN